MSDLDGPVDATGPGATEDCMATGAAKDISNKGRPLIVYTRRGRRQGNQLP